MAHRHKLNLRLLHRRDRMPGARPGLRAERVEGVDTEPTALLDVTDFSITDYVQYKDLSLEGLLELPPPEEGIKRWIHVRGLDKRIVSEVCDKFGVHPLHAEDVVHVPQRPRLETTHTYDFIAARMLMITGTGEFKAEQLCLVILDDVLLSFQEGTDRLWGKIRDRLQIADARIRSAGPDYLAYALLDFTVDHVFPITEDYLDQLGVLEKEILDTPKSDCIRRLYEMQHNLLTLRRVVTPMRDLAESLCRSTSPRVNVETVPFFTDVSHHAIQLTDVIDGCREMAVSLSDLYQASISNQANQVMKLLTLMAALFIPITFLAGVYGMNFEHIPELKMKWAYPVFWGLCIMIVSSLLVYFKKRRWLE